MPKPSRSNAGNVFLALFGAVAAAGVLGGALSLVMKGPLVTSTKLTRQNTAETQMALAGRSIVMAAASLPGTGDCDGDGMIEPLEWRVPTGSPLPPVPTGGGLIPNNMLSSNKDPWGTEYGYCAWDHGSVLLNAACRTGGTNLRLSGANIRSAPSIAIVSAGPDKKFTTTCRTFAAADITGNGILGDPTDLPMVGKAATADDDVIFTYTYDEAVGASGGIWTLKPLDPSKATIQKSLEVTGGAKFTETGLFQKLGATALPANCTGLGDSPYNDTASGSCYFISPNSTNWQDASAYCIANGASLVTISSLNEQNAIKNNMSSPYDLWLGANDIAEEGKFVWVGAELAGQQFWQGTNTGSPVNGLYSAWSPSEPNNSGGNEDCVTSSTGSGLAAWNDNDCSTTYFRALCEKSPTSSTMQVEKGLKLANPTSMPNCNTANQGTTRQNATGNGLEICTGTAWVALGGSAAPDPQLPTTFDVGYSYACAIKNDGTNWCWGANGAGQSGVGDINDYFVPVQTTGALRWTDISASNAGMTCGIATDKNGYCWGDNDYGQFGDGTTADSLVPKAIPGLEGLRQISVGNIHGCAIKADKSAVCWGDNVYGQQGNSGNSPLPAVVAPGSKWSQISAGNFHTCGIKTDGTAWCWGENTNGKLGDNTTALRDYPVAVSTIGLQTWSQISAGEQHTCGVKTDGTGWCWGSGTNGRLGRNSTSLSRVPIEFASGTQWKQLSAGQSHTCGIDTAGKAWCWGNNAWGRLGDGTTTGKLIPFEVSGNLGPFVSIGASMEHSCAMKNTGQIYCWGFGYYGNLGQGTQNNSSTPITQSGNPIFKVPVLESSSGINFPLKAPNGSAAAPSYSFLNSPSSGMYYETGALKLKSTGSIEVKAKSVLLSNPAGVEFQMSSAGLQVGYDSRTCDTAIKGTLRYIAASKKFEYCDGTAWADWASGSGGGGGSCAGLGDMSYDDPVSGHCYYVEANAIDWETSRASCQANGAYLATLSSEEESEMVGANITMPDESYVFLGASDEAVEGEWRWLGGEVNGVQFWQGDVNGSPVGGMYNAWYEGMAPQDSGGALNCLVGGYLGSFSVMFGRYYIWLDYGCTMDAPSGSPAFTMCEKG